jgi:hypothetical protein
VAGGDGAQCSGIAFTQDDKHRFLNTSGITLFNVRLTSDLNAAKRYGGYSC